MLFNVMVSLNLPGEAIRIEVLNRTKYRHYGILVAYHDGHHLRSMKLFANN